MKIPWGFILFFILTFVPLAIPSAEVPYTILVALIGIAFSLCVSSVMSERRFGILGHMRVDAQFGSVTQGRLVALLQNAIVALCIAWSGWYYALFAWFIAAIMLDITLTGVATSKRMMDLYVTLRAQGIHPVDIESEIARRLK